MLVVRKKDVDAPAGNDGATIDVDIVPSPDSHLILITRKESEESSVSPDSHPIPITWKGSEELSISLVWRPRLSTTRFVYGCVMLLTDVHNYGMSIPPTTTTGHDFDADADYTIFSINPADYPPSELLCAPSPTSESNGTFCLEMGKFEGRRRDTRRSPSPSPSLLKEGERENQKLRLTIAVPASGSGAGSDTYHNHRRTRSYNVRRKVFGGVCHTDAGADGHGWRCVGLG